MTEITVSFEKLSEKVLLQLSEHGYTEQTITNYRRFYNRIHEYMNDMNRQQYSSDVGDQFLNDQHVGKTAMSFYTCAVRRLNDCSLSKPYRSHRSMKADEAPVCFSEIIHHYLEECKNKGNQTYTINAKEKNCILFSKYIGQTGCTDFAQLNTELISKALSIYENKDHYALLRQFLRFLYEQNITETDYSYIIPHYKRRMLLPTTYTPSEIKKVEDSVDTETPVGKRNLAILKLITRMGLRSGDVAKLKRSEIDFENNVLSIIQEKTNQPLSLYMPPEVCEALKQHLDNLISNDEFVFHGCFAPYQRITTSIIRHIVNDGLKAAGVDTSNKKHGPHAFRSSLASSMVNDGASYETVRRILGHTDPNVIKHYAKTDIEMLRLCSIKPPDPTGLFKDYLSGKKVVFHV